MSVSSVSAQVPEGLRERKKLATRRALAAAAMRLAIERGLDNVLAEDIAAAVDVSPRTFRNYFSSKYEAICAFALDRFVGIGDALRARPSGESLWNALRNAVLDAYAPASTAPEPTLMAGIRLVTSSPVLRGEYLKILSVMQYDLADAIADRVGSKPADDTFFVRGLAGAITAVVQAATERWLAADPPLPITPLIENALDDLAEGMLSVLSKRSAHADQAPPRLPAATGQDDRRHRPSAAGPGAGHLVSANAQR